MSPCEDVLQGFSTRFWGRPRLKNYGPLDLGGPIGSFLVKSRFSMASKLALRQRNSSITKDIRITIPLRAASGEVYRALTSARELCIWLAQRAETDARSMGRLRIVWPKADWIENNDMTGVFVDLEPEKKVAWLWDDRSCPQGVPPLVSMFIEERPRRSGTSLTLVHAGFSGAAAKRKLLEAFRLRWEDFLAKLRFYLDAGKTCKAERLTFADLETRLKRKRS
ncbi:MAG: hypothetical protein COB53_08375 [Elusimicrobia bacterium]|nr:MAG: hypothetical protein COB53_08375 [Elusimicrobiota bacterium]